MTMNDLAHNVEEYIIGKGILTLKPLGEEIWYDVGNVPEFEFTPNVEELPHNSARAGTRLRDRTVVLEKGGDVRIVMEEWTSFNMAIILLGDIETIPGVEPEDPATQVIDILSRSQFTAGVRFQGMNDIGARWNFEFYRVDFIPSGSLNPISDEWGSLEVNGRLAAVLMGDNMRFGTARRMTDGSSPGWPAQG